MIYPSHFANEKDNGVGSEINGVLFTHPDLQPYEVVYNALMEYKWQADKFASDNPGALPAIVRPYLQCFTADWIYGTEAYPGDPDSYYMIYYPEQVRAQIQAVYDAGYEEWILWRTSNNNYRAELFEVG